MSENPANRYLRQASRFKNLGPLAPRLRIGLRLDSGEPERTYFRLPFRRSLPLILILGAFLAAFCVPYFTMGGFISGSGDDSLFNLVFTLFSLFWILGWSVGVFILLAVFLVVTCGTEVLQIRPGQLTVRIEVLRLGVGADFQASGISNLRWEEGQPGTAGEAPGNAWRGDHLAFDYGGETVRVGSSLAAQRAAEIIQNVQQLAIDQAGSPAELSRHGAGLEQSRPVVKAVDRPRPAVEDPGRQATSTWVLVAANLIPLAGVLLAGWDIGDIMLLFWAESAIIGLFNLLKMWMIGRWSVLFAGPFFIGHFGGFMTVHLLFIYTLFLSGPEGGDPSVSQVVADFFLLWPALLGLTVSHAVSFWLNFVGRREYLETDLRQQMNAPYRRIVVMHMTIILGGFLSMAFNAPLLALVLLIVLKIAVDLKSHVSEHRRLKAAGSAVSDK